ncbi:hypothetical protein LM599_03495 [Candidatus Acetothermia bacterium]|nr:hypothetical protein [Candidatus Acetothermia bacterium]
MTKLEFLDKLDRVVWGVWFNVQRQFTVWKEFVVQSQICTVCVHSLILTIIETNAMMRIN